MFSIQNLYLCVCNYYVNECDHTLPPKSFGTHEKCPLANAFPFRIWPNQMSLSLPAFHGNEVCHTVESINQLDHLVFKLFGGSVIIIWAHTHTHI